MLPPPSTTNTRPLPGSLSAARTWGLFSKHCTVLARPEKRVTPPKSRSPVPPKFGGMMAMFGWPARSSTGALKYLSVRSHVPARDASGGGYVAVAAATVAAAAMPRRVCWRAAGRPLRAPRELRASITFLPARRRRPALVRRHPGLATREPATGEHRLAMGTNGDGAPAREVRSGGARRPVQSAPCVAAHRRRRAGEISGRVPCTRGQHAEQSRGGTARGPHAPEEGPKAGVRLSRRVVRASAHAGRRRRGACAPPPPRCASSRRSTAGRPPGREERLDNAGAASTRLLAAASSRGRASPTTSGTSSK